MIYFKHNILLFYCFFSTSIFSQSTSPEIIGSSGEFYKNGSSQIQFTVGEVVVETFNNSSNYLTQGFHQTNLKIESIEDNDISIDMSLYPNPSIDEITLFISNTNEEFSIIIYDALGKQIYTTNIIGRIEKRINISKYSSGMYLLHLTNNTNRTIKTYKIQKHK